ncbi:MAG: hypothetical protein AAF890_03060 [Pseudomonadota bacterium]
MKIQFRNPPDRYLAESQTSSPLWTIWFPTFVFIAIPVVAYAYTPFFMKWFASERQGLLEFLHFFLPLLTGLIGLRLVFSDVAKSDPLLRFWCFAMFLGGIYLAGEEASWGQHYVGWVTPDGWATLNDQQETNLHNVSNLLDQLPRGILMAGIVITGIIYPWILIHKPGLLPARFDFIYPPLALRWLAVLISLCWGYRALRKNGDLGEFLVYRPGEFQEIFIVWFLFYYALFLFWRARSVEAAAN